MSRARRSRVFAEAPNAAVMVADERPTTMAAVTAMAITFRDEIAGFIKNSIQRGRHSARTTFGGYDLAVTTELGHIGRKAGHIFGGLGRTFGELERFGR